MKNLYGVLESSIPTEEAILGAHSTRKRVGGESEREISNPVATDSHGHLVVEGEKLPFQISMWSEVSLSLTGRDSNRI